MGPKEEAMPSNTGLNLFLQATPATDDQLFALIDVRMAAIKPLLEDAPLRPLNKWLFIDHRGRGGALHFEDRKGEMLGFFMPPHDKVECHIFPAFDAAEPVELSFRNEKDEKHTIAAHHVYHWGVDREGRWFIVKAEFWEDAEKGPLIHNVWVWECASAREICEKLKLTPRTVLNLLCEMVVYWTDGAKASYEELRRIRDEIYEQNHVLGALDKKK